MTLLALAENLTLSPGEVLLFAGVLTITVGALSFMVRRYMDSNDSLRKSIESLTLVLGQLELKLVKEYVNKQDHKDDLKALEERLKTHPPHAACRREDCPMRGLDD